MTWRFSGARILLFAREPVAGAVKTRMEPVLGADGALALHRALIRHMAGVLDEAALCPWRYCVAGDPGHPVFRARDSMDWPAWSQEGVDLGERMRNAADRALREAGAVVLVGADCVSVDRSCLEEALTALAGGHDVVLGPAEDGGYVLLGLRGTQWPLFADMPWGSARVLPETRDRLRASGARWVELAPRWDVDRPEDLPRLRELDSWRGPLPC